MVVIRDEERRERAGLRLSAAHDESSDSDSTSLCGVVEDKHFRFIIFAQDPDRTWVHLNAFCLLSDLSRLV